jgi:hypothetical protein
MARTTQNKLLPVPSLLSCTRIRCSETGLHVTVSQEYGKTLLVAEVPFSATDSGRRTSCELKTVLPICMQIEREDG